jgi:hypothetical protein
MLLEAKINFAYATYPQLVPPMLLALTKLLDLNATLYKSMMAYGMHLRYKGIEVHRNTFDIGVTTSFDHIHKLSVDDPNLEVQREEYLGWIEEILKPNYKKHCVVVLAFNWVKARYSGLNPTIVWDKYGFISVNMLEMTVFGLGPNCFAFLFMSTKSSTIKTAMGRSRGLLQNIEVRGRRGDHHYTLEEEDGHDFQFEGLSPNREADKAHQQAYPEANMSSIHMFPPVQALWSLSQMVFSLGIHWKMTSGRW